MCSIKRGKHTLPGRQFQPTRHLYDGPMTGPMTEERARRELLRLVAIASESGREAGILAYLEARLEALGLAPLWRQPVEGAGANLVWSPHPRPRLLLTAHADTVPTWGHPELERPRAEDGRVFGRGSADVKGGIAALLLALEAAAQDGRLDRAPLAVAFTVDEEEGGRGASALPHAVRAEAAVVLEPTDLAVCPAQAGFLEARVVVTGVTAHGSELEAGRNAIHEAAALMVAFRDLSFVRAAHPRVGLGGYNVREVRGGRDALVIPDRCELRVDFRILPDQDPEAAAEELRTLAARHGATVAVTDSAPAFALGEDAPVVALMRAAYRAALGRPAPLAGMKSWTDAEELHAAGIPSVVFGPGRLAVAHTPGEHVEVRAVVDAARVLAAAIAAVAPPP